MTKDEDAELAETAKIGLLNTEVKASALEESPKSSEYFTTCFPSEMIFAIVYYIHFIFKFYNLILFFLRYKFNFLENLFLTPLGLS